MQKCQLFIVQKFWREIQSGLEAIEVFLEVMIYVLHTVVKGFILVVSTVPVSKAGVCRRDV